MATLWLTRGGGKSYILILRAPRSLACAIIDTTESEARVVGLTRRTTTDWTPFVALASERATTLELTISDWPQGAGTAETTRAIFDAGFAAPPTHIDIFRATYDDGVRFLPIERALWPSDIAIGADSFQNPIANKDLREALAKADTIARSRADAARTLGLDIESIFVTVSPVTPGPPNDQRPTRHWPAIAVFPTSRIGASLAISRTPGPPMSSMPEPSSYIHKILARSREYDHELRLTLDVPVPDLAESLRVWQVRRRNVAGAANLPPELDEFLDRRDRQVEPLPRQRWKTSDDVAFDLPIQPARGDRFVFLALDDAVRVRSFVDPRGAVIGVASILPLVWRHNGDEVAPLQPSDPDATDAWDLIVASGGLTPAPAQERGWRRAAAAVEGSPAAHDTRLASWREIRDALFPGDGVAGAGLGDHSLFLYLAIVRRWFDLSPSNEAALATAIGRDGGTMNRLLCAVAEAHAAAPTNAVGLPIDLGATLGLNDAARVVVAYRIGLAAYLELEHARPPEWLPLGWLALAGEDKLLLYILKRRLNLSPSNALRAEIVDALRLLVRALDGDANATQQKYVATQLAAMGQSMIDRLAEDPSVLYPLPWLDVGPEFQRAEDPAEIKRFEGAFVELKTEIETVLGPDDTPHVSVAAQARAIHEWRTSGYSAARVIDKIEEMVARPGAGALSPVTKSEIRRLAAQAEAGPLGATGLEYLWSRLSWFDSIVLRRRDARAKQSDFLGDRRWILESSRGYQTTLDARCAAFELEWSDHAITFAPSPLPGPTAKEIGLDGNLLDIDVHRNVLTGGAVPKSPKSAAAVDDVAREAVARIGRATVKDNGSSRPSLTLVFVDLIAKFGEKHLSTHDGVRNAFLALRAEVAQDLVNFLKSSLREDRARAHKMKGEIVGLLGKLDAMRALLER